MGEAAKVAWEELLQRPKRASGRMSIRTRTSLKSAVRKRRRISSRFPQRARRNHSLSGVGTYVLRDSLHHGLHMLRKTTSAASVACLCESRLGHGAGVLFIVVMRLDPERG
jgi:hypothetical protein